MTAQVPMTFELRRAWSPASPRGHATAPWRPDAPGRRRAWPRRGAARERPWRPRVRSDGRARACRGPSPRAARSPRARRTPDDVPTAAAPTGPDASAACRQPPGTTAILPLAPRPRPGRHPRSSGRPRSPARTSGDPPARPRPADQGTAKEPSAPCSNHASASPSQPPSSKRRDDRSRPPSSPPAPGPTRCGKRASASPWTGRAGSSTASSSSGEPPSAICPRTMGERRSVKYECVHLHAWETGSEARAGLSDRFDLCNHRRPHAALDGQPPDVIYRTRTTTTQPDHETRRVAQIPPDPVQGSGSSSLRRGPPRRPRREAARERA
jgi:putative transposase